MVVGGSREGKDSGPQSALPEKKAFTRDWAESVPFPQPATVREIPFAPFLGDKW